MAAHKNPEAHVQPGGRASVPPGSRVALSVRGADISSLKKSEDKGGVYAYEDGIRNDAPDLRDMD
jgi:hypothetical protein